MHTMYLCGPVVHLLCRRTMMAFSPGGGQPITPFLPGSLISARLGFTGQRRASDPFNPPSVSRSSSSTPTTQVKTPESLQGQSISTLNATKAITTGIKSSLDSTQGIASNQALDYLRTASLPHVPTQPQLALGLLQQFQTPAMSNPREL